MIGYQEYEPPDAHQRYRQRLYWLRTVPTWQKVAAASLLVLAPTALTMWSTTAPTVLPEAAGAGAFVSAATTQSTQWHGVSLGGWLVMEINPAAKKEGDPMDLRPSWMYDEIEANSELDFVLKLRKEHGDAYAIQTMKNHWDGYITDAQLDAAQALGVDTVRSATGPNRNPKHNPKPNPHPNPKLKPKPHPNPNPNPHQVRIPLGYWIADPPVGGSSPLEYGISPEGFVTGGLNHLRQMLAQLARRGMGALVDVHAHPCNSACVSDGQYCATTLAFAPAGDGIGDIGNGGLGAIRDMARCGGGSYKTTRKPRTGEATWGDVGVNAVEKLAEWLAALPPSEQVAPLALPLKGPVPVPLPRPSPLPSP